MTALHGERNRLASESLLGARITIWRPFNFEKNLTFHNGEGQDVSIVGPDMIFQQDAFSWHVREDIWGGLVDSEKRSELSERLMVDFQPTLPPSQRSLEKLMVFLQEAEVAAAASEWSNSAQYYEKDGETPQRLNALLSFCVQLRWICQVFKDLPGASVSVR